MLTETRRPRDSAAGAPDALELVPLRSFTHRQAVDLFHSTKATIVQRALSSQESLRLLGSAANIVEQRP